MEQELGDVSREVLSKGSRARSETIESSGSEGRSRLPHDVNFGYNRSAASPGSSDIAIAVSDPEGDIEAAQAGLRGQISELSLLARFEDEEYSIGRGARIHVDEQWTSTKEYQVPRLNTPTGHMPRTVRHDRGDGSQTSWFNDRDSGGKEKSRSPGDVEMSDLKDQQRRAWTQCFESGLSTNEDLIAREGADPGMQVNQQRGSSGRPAHTQRSTISEDRKRKLKPSQKSSRQKRERRKEREAKRKAKRKKDEWGRPTSLIKDLREGRFLV